MKKVNMILKMLKNLWCKPTTSDADSTQKISDNLWNEKSNIDHSSFTYSEVLVEQYKLYIELTDRTSQRRATANRFFFTVHAAIVVGLIKLDTFLDSIAINKVVPWLFAVPLLTILLAFCWVWDKILQDYEKLSSTKWQVVGAIEERLPTSPWWKAEWKALGEGKNRSFYWPVSRIERFVPRLFGAMYITILLALLIAKTVIKEQAV